MAAADKDQEGPRCPGAGLSLGVPSRSRPGRVGGRPRCWNHDHDPQQRGTRADPKALGQGEGLTPDRAARAALHQGWCQSWTPISLHVVTASPRPVFCPVPLGQSPLLAGTAQMPGAEKGSADCGLFQPLGAPGDGFPCPPVCVVAGH